MNHLNPPLLLFALLALAGPLPSRAAESPRNELAPPPILPSGPAVQEASRLYVLRADDIILIKVYQEDDLTSQARIARDGTITLPLLGTVNLGSNTVEQAVGLIRDKLAKDYLVNPQVSLSIVEYGKRRFTVLGQVSRPGTYEMTTEEPLNLLEAIATAGGFTRIGNPHKVIVQRMVGEQKKIFKLDATSMAEDKRSKPFIVQPEDTITIGEKWL